MFLDLKTQVNVAGMAHVVDDITNDDQLIRFAARAQVLHLGEAVGEKITASTIAKAMGVADARLAAALNPGPMPPSLLPRLDAALITLGPDDDDLGGLSAFAARLKGSWGEGHIAASIPAAWTRPILNLPLDGPVGMLTQASALLSGLDSARSLHAQSRVVERYRPHLARVVEQLMLIGICPPTRHSIEALVLLGSIARVPAAFQVMRERLETGLDSPLGFRVWRAVTSVVRAIGPGDQVAAKMVRPWVEIQLRENWRRHRELSLYPARSLDLELAIAVPADWSPAGNDWAGEVLRERAMMHDVTVRERGTAALGVWQRAFVSGDTSAIDDARNFLRTFAKTIREEAEDDGVKPGRHWLAATVEHALNTNRHVCTTWPEVAQPCLTETLATVETLNHGSVHPKMRDAAKQLFQQIILQNAGVHRRRAIDTFRAAGLAGPATTLLRGMLKNPRIEPWLRCRILFAIGFLQERGYDVLLDLCEAYDEARENLVIEAGKDRVTRDMISEIHAAIFALGDCFGAFGAEREAGRLRERVDKTLWDLITAFSAPRYYPVSRAAAYLTIVTASEHDLSRLEELAKHPDPATARAGKWGADARFVNGRLRPLHHAYRGDAWEIPPFPLG